MLYKFCCSNVSVEKKTTFYTIKHQFVTRLSSNPLGTSINTTKPPIPEALFVLQNTKQACLSWYEGK